MQLLRPRSCAPVRRHRRVRALSSAAHAPEVTIAIARNGAVVFVRGYGLRDVGPLVAGRSADALRDPIDCPARSTSTPRSPQTFRPSRTARRSPSAFGTQSAYSNTSYPIRGRIVEVVSGERCRQPASRVRVCEAAGSQGRAPRTKQSRYRRRDRSLLRLGRAGELRARDLLDLFPLQRLMSKLKNERDQSSRDAAAHIKKEPSLHSDDDKQ